MIGGQKCVAESMVLGGNGVIWIGAGCADAEKLCKTQEIHTIHAGSEIWYEARG